MPYKKLVDGANPTCFIFLLDRSGSMSEQWNEKAKKMEYVASIINTLLKDLINKCTKGDVYKNYFHISAIGYGDNKVEPAFAGKLSDQFICTIEEIANNASKTKDNKPFWIKPAAGGNTPMFFALEKAYSILEGWVKSHQSSYPPLVINITDGEILHEHTPNNEQIPEIAEKIKGLKTSDGNVLLFNVHIASQMLDNGSDKIVLSYPDLNTLQKLLKEKLDKSDEHELHWRNIEALFNMSSDLTPDQQRIIEKHENIVSSDDAQRRKGFLFNSKPEKVISFLKTGTQQNTGAGIGTSPVPR